MVSTSRLTPWAAPAASFIRRPISSKNRLLVWVIWKISGRLRWVRYFLTMAILTAQFKADLSYLSRPVALSCGGFLAIVSLARAKNRQPQTSRNAHDRPADR